MTNENRQSPGGSIKDLSDQKNERRVSNASLVGRVVYPSSDRG